jgi:hypothetical protein
MEKEKEYCLMCQGLGAQKILDDLLREAICPYYYIDIPVGIDVLIANFNQFLREHGSKIRLLLIKDDDSYYIKLKE